MSTATSSARDELTAILIRSGRGDRQAFAELYARTSSKLFGLCLRMLRDRGEAEDVLQEIYVTVWRRAAGFDAARAGAITWLVTLARNKAIDRLRQRREEPRDAPLDTEAAADERPLPDANAQSGEERRRLRRCLDALDPQQGRAVREAFYSGATYNELALRCAVPLGTMKSWIRRGLMQLRTCLEQ